MRVLVVEGWPEARRSYAQHLRDAGHAVDAVDSLYAAQRAVVDVDFDCVVVGGLASGDEAAEFLAEVRSDRRNRPVLAIIDDGVVSRTEVLEAGVDDLLISPVSLAELAARVRRLIVRGTPPGVDPGFQRIGPLALHPGRGEVLIDGEPVALPRIQYSLLSYLLRHRDRVVTARELLRHAWDRNQVFERNPLPVQISRLRKNIRGAVRIDAVRGLGYRLREPADGGSRESDPDPDG